MKSINPYTLKVEKKLSNHSIDEVTQILPKINRAYENWKTTTFSHRAELFMNLSSILKENKQDLAELVTLEMGKPIQQAVSEVEKCAWVCEYYAEHAEEFLADEELPTDYEKSVVSYEPLGAILGVMPWNFPYWQAFRFFVPTLMAGNVAILKHASNVPQCALKMEELLLEAGFPKHVFTTFLISSDLVETIINSNFVKAISLTGSEKAGSIVASQAAKQIKKSLLELGGSDVFIVCEDADIEKTAEQAVIGRFQNNGQSCIASKRFLVQNAIYDEFMEVFKRKVEELKVGNPMDEDVFIGPLAKPSFVQDIAKQVKASIAMGATILTGGKVEGDKEQFYLPTILENVTEEMPVFKEETFGPVAAVTAFDTIEDAIQYANNSKFGLGGSVWTTDLQKGLEVARKIESGTVAVNDITKSDPRVPFGGIKTSGFGRELAKQGILEFVNHKAIHLNAISKK